MITPRAVQAHLFSKLLLHILTTGEIIQKFMVDRYNFPSLEAAKEVRDSYFARFHATAKGLTVAQQEGMFPPGSPLFDTKDLCE